MQQELIVEGFGKEGQGLAFIPKENSSLKVEIPHTIPGDTIIALLRKKRKRRIKARLIEILHPSPQRIIPICSHAQICGGCMWQCLDYSQQLAYKQRSIREYFQEYDEDIFSPIIPCEQLFRYRNKMEFSFSQNRGGTKYLGLMIARAKRYVFNVEQCFLVDSWFSKVLEAIRLWWHRSTIDAYRIEDNTGTLRTVTMREARETKEKMVILTISGNPSFSLNREQLDSFIMGVKGVFTSQELKNVSLFLRHHHAIKGQPTQFYEVSLFGKDKITEKITVQYKNVTHSFYCHISPSSFFQPNLIQTKILFSKILELAEPSLDDIVYDLYCGSGVIGMAFAPFVHKVFGIELNPNAVADAKENLEINRIENCSIYHGAIEEILPVLMGEKRQPPSILIVDPPRAGLQKRVLDQIKILNPKKILYISCNPKTQAEDIRFLPYSLKRIQPIDQFPHTIHIENIALLVRN